MNKLNLTVWIALASLFIMISSCGKENYDISDTKEEEVEPTTNYTGPENNYGFSFTIITPDNTNVSGGTSVDNKITLNQNNDLLEWKVTSTVQDGDFMVLAETTFFTSNMDGGTFPIDELRLVFDDGSGMSEEYIWEASEIAGNIEISNLSGTPEFVSGAIGTSMNGPAIETNYQYVAEFSKIPFD